MKPRYRVVIEQVMNGWVNSRLVFCDSIPTPDAPLPLNSDITFEEVRRAINSAAVIELDEKSVVVLERHAAPDGLYWERVRVLQSTKIAHMNAEREAPAVDSSQMPGRPPASGFFPPGVSPSSEGRQSAGNALRSRVRRLREQADGLETLAKMADTLTPGSPEELALWEMAFKK